MQNSEGLRKKTTFITALALSILIGLPVSSFAFRNPNQDPRDIVQIQENPGISTSAASAVDTPNTKIQGAIKDDNDDSVNQAAGVLRSGEISSASPAAASLRKTSGFDAFNSLNQNRWQATFSSQNRPREASLWGKVQSLRRQS